MLVLPNVTIEPSFVRKIFFELPNMTTVQSHVILALQNLKMVPSNVRKKKKWVQPNVAKVLLYVMLVLLNMIIETSNVREKKRKLSNVTKVWSHVTMELSNVR